MKRNCVEIQYKNAILLRYNFEVVCYEIIICLLRTMQNSNFG